MFSLNEIHFAALDNQVSVFAEQVARESFLNISWLEEFTAEDVTSIIAAGKNLIVKYTDAKYKDVGLIKTEYSLPVLAKLLSVTSLSIVLKWLCDYAWSYDFCELAEVDRKQVAYLERDILQTFDYNIFRFMPVRPQREFLKGSPVIEAELPPPTPKHLAPIPIPEPSTPETSHKNPWSCLCWWCEHILEETNFSLDNLKPYPVMSSDDFWSHYNVVRIWLKQFPHDDYQNKTRALVRRYRMFLTNPRRWNDVSLDYWHKASNKMVTEATESGYLPYIVVVNRLFEECWENTKYQTWTCTLTSV